MNYKKYTHATSKTLFISISIFVLFVILYFIVQTNYIKDNEKNYVEAIHQEVTLLIQLKKNTTADIAKEISLNKVLINIMKTKKYAKLYDDNVFKIAKKFKMFNHVALHVVDAKGITRYISWAQKSLGDNILHARKDLRILYNHPQQMSSISVGKFDITFKGIMPIYDKEHTFLGIIEVITHFNSISAHLAADKIYTALIIDKRFNQQLIHPLSKTFIDGYNISTLELNPTVEKLIRREGIKKLHSVNCVAFYRDSFFSTGFYVTKVAIYGVDKKVIGHFLVFITDKYKLHDKVLLLRAITIIMTLLFFLMVFFVIRANRKNNELIHSLHNKVIKETEKNLALVYNDALTKCYKKEKFLLDKKRYKKSTLVMLNIKNFSQVNTTYGFSIGDEVLQQTAKKLRTILDQVPYRIDSDEFVFVSDDVERDILRVQAHFRESSLHLTHDDINLRISFCFAVVNGKESDLLRKLTIALKQAKQEPFKSYVYYKEEGVNNDFIKFNSYLYEAIFSQQDARIIPYFQGIRNNKTGKILKYESLARLEVGQELYSPYFFIDIAKNSGFLFEITKIMIDKSFAFISQQDPEINISINITEDDLLSKKLKSYLIEKLEFHGLQAKRITLEILEGISAKGAHNSIMQLKELKEFGFSLAIDDFGVEYSNFERINELEVDFIKIDGKYIKELVSNPKSYKITKAIADFAHSMDIEVIAEFVENEKIQKIVEEIGIDYSQGYCFSKPAATLLDKSS